jgi:hypothetical protein
MHDASPPRLRLFVSVAAFLIASAFTSAAAPADDAEPAYFSARFGGRIERVVAGPDGTIYVAGVTKVADLPASTSAPDPGSGENPSRILFFVAALERDGRPRWTSYAVGSAFEWMKSVRGLAVSPDGSVWIAAVGSVDPVPESQPGPSESYFNDTDLVLAKFAADGTLLFAGNVAGERDDTVAALAVTANGDAIVVGTTFSDDFPGAPRPVTSGGWRADAFVAQVHGDGSGVAWARRFGGDADQNQNFQGCGVALDAADGTIVAGIAGSLSGARAPFAGDLSAPKGVKSPRLYDSDLTCEVIRLTGAGEQIQGARLRFLGPQPWGSRFGAPVALAPDGTVLVGGVLGVARITRELFLGVEDVWVHRQRWTVAERMCVDPAGRVIVAERPFGYEDGYVITVRGPALADGETSVDRVTELGFRPTDIAVDADGSLLVVGTGDGASFGAPYETTGTATGHVARVPLDGVRGPSRLRARVVSTREVDVTWSRDGDPASGFDIERVGPDAAPFLVGHVAGDVSGYRATGLTPGEVHRLRVVASFPSGVRSASPVRQVRMPPEPPLSVVATRAADGSVEVRWEHPNGRAVTWQMQRRFGDGEWMRTGFDGVWPVGRQVGGLIYESRAADVVADVAVPVWYRVRAVSPTGDSRSAWTESSPLAPSGSMLLSLRNGSLRRDESGVTELFASGKIAPAGGGPALAFDPAAQDLCVVFGDAAAPREFVIVHGYPGWTSADGELRWSAAGALTPWSDGSEIVLDFTDGTFFMALRSYDAFGAMTTNSVALSLRFGEFSGGDVEVWRGRSGSVLDLAFPGPPDPARKRVR